MSKDVSFQLGTRMQQSYDGRRSVTSTVVRQRRSGGGQVDKQTLQMDGRVEGLMRPQSSKLSLYL